MLCFNSEWGCFDYVFMCAHLSLTAVRIWLHSVPQRSCSAQSPCATLPLPVSKQSSLAPERLLVLWSDSLLDAWHLVNVWLQRCSSSSAASICHPEIESGHKIKCWGQISFSLFWKWPCVVIKYNLIYFYITRSRVDKRLQSISLCLYV